MLQGVNLVSPRKIGVNLLNPWKYFKYRVNLGLTPKNILSPGLRGVNLGLKKQDWIPIQSHDAGNYWLNLRTPETTTLGSPVKKQK